MKDCCKSTQKDKQCVRNSDKKIFSLPRRFTKERCDQGINGFTMRSSCSPYKDCLKKKSKKKKQSKKRTYRGGAKQRNMVNKPLQRNMVNKPLQPCSTNPKTGYSRSGYCAVVPGDQGVHTVCAQMTQPFLDFTKDRGNDLSSVVSSSDKWCLCQNRWLEAFRAGVAPPVIQASTHQSTDKSIQSKIRKHPVTIVYLAGGCFWGLEHKVKQVPGVIDTDVGYMGGKGKPTYKTAGSKGYAETVCVVYDSSKCSFESLVSQFFQLHDPTTRNKQGPDIGPQYRSIAFYSDQSEKQTINRLIQKDKRKIVTQVKPVSQFYKAEPEHQDYVQGGALRKPLPQLRKIDKSWKKHIYKLKDPQKKRILAIDEGIRHSVKQGQTAREAALSKKKRFNLLRLYRKNKDPNQCRRLTADMKYMDKKYGTGTTKDICKPKRGGGLKKTQRKRRDQKKRANQKKQQFLFNPEDPKKSFDVYIDKDPTDTIPIKYTTVQDVKDTIQKLERLYKAGKYTHKRIGQVAMILEVRLRVLQSKKPKQHRLAERYCTFLKKRTLVRGEKERMNYKFII